MRDKEKHSSLLRILAIYNYKEFYNIEPRGYIHEKKILRNLWMGQT
jgi:hypothetical protein